MAVETLDVGKKGSQFFSFSLIAWLFTPHPRNGPAIKRIIFLGLPVGILKLLGYIMADILALADWYLGLD